MTFNLTLTGDNPAELAKFLTALGAITGTNHAPVSNSQEAQLSAPAPVVADAVHSTNGLSNGIGEAPAKAIAPKKATAAAKKAAVQKAAEAQSAPAQTDADTDAIDGFSAAIENAAAADDFDFGLDLGTKTSGWTVEEVREKAKEVVNAGKQLQLREALNQFGAASISTLDSQHYDGFMGAINKITY